MARRPRADVVAPPVQPAEAGAVVELDAVRAKRERRLAEVLARAESPFALVSSRHPRTVEAGGLTIRHGRWTPVSRDALGAERYADIVGAGYVLVTYINAERYADECARVGATLPEPVPTPENARIEALRREIDQLKADLAAAHREIALLTGRRTGGTGPREGHRDDNSPPV